LHQLDLGAKPCPFTKPSLQGWVRNSREKHRANGPTV
jgi:hypothetical protein